MGQCDMCGQEPQTMQIGNMETGEQLFVGTGCFARFGLDFAKRTLEAEEIAAQLGPMFVTPDREDLHEDAKVERAKRPRKSKAKAETAEGEADGSSQVAPTAANE